MKLELELVMELVVHCDPALEVGPSHEGFRRVIPITGGTFKGPKIKGVILPGGADWNLSRADGVDELWARYTLQANDGTLISVMNQGIIHNKPIEVSGEDAIDADLKTEQYAYTSPSFEVSGEKYKWLTNHMFIGTLKHHPKGVHLHFYKMS